MKDKITLTLTYQECLIIRHCLDEYADKWVGNIRELLRIANCECASAEVKEECAKKIREIDPIRISTQRLWKKVSDEMYGISYVPEHCLSTF